MVLPPLEKRQSGCPKMKRIPSQREKIQTKTCPRYCIKGHTRLTSKNLITCRNGKESRKHQDALNTRLSKTAEGANIVAPTKKRGRKVHYRMCTRYGTQFVNAKQKLKWRI